MDVEILSGADAEQMAAAETGTVNGDYVAYELDDVTRRFSLSRLREEQRGNADLDPEDIEAAQRVRDALLFASRCRPRCASPRPWWAPRSRTTVLRQVRQVTYPLPLTRGRRLIRFGLVSIGVDAKQTATSSFRRGEAGSRQIQSKAVSTR